MKGFTLIETLVVIGIFGILMLAGTAFLLSMMRNSNQIKIQTELRQTASRIMQDITSEMHKGGSITGTFSGSTLTINNSSGTIIYTANINGTFSKTVGSVTTFFTQNSVGIAQVLNDPDCDLAAIGSGFVVTPAAIDSGHPAVVTLTVQAPAMSSPEFCPRVVLNDTLVPREY